MERPSRLAILRIETRPSSTARATISTKRFENNGAFLKQNSQQKARWDGHYYERYPLVRRAQWISREGSTETSRHIKRRAMSPPGGLPSR